MKLQCLGDAGVLFFHEGLAAVHEQLIVGADVHRFPAEQFLQILEQFFLLSQLFYSILHIESLNFLAKNILNSRNYIHGAIGGAVSIVLRNVREGQRNALYVCHVPVNNIEVVVLDLLEGVREGPSLVIKAANIGEQQSLITFANEVLPVDLFGELAGDVQIVELYGVLVRLKFE